MQMRVMSPKRVVSPQLSSSSVLINNNGNGAHDNDENNDTYIESPSSRFGSKGWKRSFNLWLRKHGITQSNIKRYVRSMLNQQLTVAHLLILFIISILMHQLLPHRYDVLHLLLHHRPASSSSSQSILASMPANNEMVGAIPLVSNAQIDLATRAPRWYDDPSNLERDWLQDAPSSVSADHGLDKTKTTATTGASSQPAFHHDFRGHDCAMHYARPASVQSAMERRLSLIHDRVASALALPSDAPSSSSSRSSGDGTSTGADRPPSLLPSWWSRFHLEFSTALDLERNDFPAALARWLLPELDRLEFQARPVPLRCTRHAVLMVESRSEPFVLFAVRNTFFMLSSDTQRWGLVIYHSLANERFLVEGLQIWPGGAGQHIELHLMSAQPASRYAHTLNTPRSFSDSSPSALAQAASSGSGSAAEVEEEKSPFDRDFANAFLISSALWRSLPVENILHVQSDGVMIKPCGSGLGEWLRFTNAFVYVGAPFPHPRVNTQGMDKMYSWSEQHTPFAGNGGVSFRKRSMMLDVTTELHCDLRKKKDPRSQRGCDDNDGEEFNTAPPPPSPTCYHRDRYPLTSHDELEITLEDRWIGRELYRRSARYRHQIPFAALARKFAVDTIYDEDAFFVHKYWQLYTHWGEEFGHGKREKAMRLLIQIKAYYQGE